MAMACLVLQLTVDADGKVTSGADGYTADVRYTNQALTAAICDTDGDLVSPVADLDDDNDGILDSLEVANATQWDITSGSPGNTINNFASITQNGVTSTLSITSTAAQLTAGTGSDLVSFREETAQTITISADSGLREVALFVDQIYNKINDTTFLGNFTATLVDGTVLSDLDFYMTDDSAGYTVTNETEGLITKRLINGKSYAYDALGDGQNNQAYGTIFFPTLQNITLASKAVKSLSFDVIPVNNAAVGYLGFYGSIMIDTDGDDSPDYLDLDSDGDDCLDVNEAGFTDPDGDGLLGPASVTVDADGKVTSGADGYTAPDARFQDPNQLNGCSRRVFINPWINIRNR